MDRLRELIKKEFWLLATLAFSIAIFIVAARINDFRYYNFDYGKFDLGNMTQMVWNTLHGRFMYLTDYFGTDLPRWAMSHVDPIILLSIPFFMIWQSPMTLVYLQLFVVVFSSVLVFKIAKLEIRSDLAAFLLSVAFLMYPALGYINAVTGYHGVSFAIPFFFLAFYVFELMYKNDDFSLRKIVIFWVSLVILMSGKEQLPLYVVLLGFFILLFRTNYSEKIGDFSLSKDFFGKFLKLIPVKTALSMILIGTAWFYTAFFVIIPNNAHYRVEGYREFARTLEIDTGNARDVALPNYFLSRYDDFGDSYSDVIINIILHPSMSARVFFGGEKMDNLVMTFGPLMYLPLAMPHILLMSLPDFIANYMTTAGGVGTAEIANHRISMIIPVLFISVIYFIGAFSRVITGSFFRTVEPTKFQKEFIRTVIPVLLVFTGLYTSGEFNNPVYLWINQAIERRLPKVFAKTANNEYFKKDLKIGDVITLSQLDNKDVECNLKIVNMIPDGVSVSGPDGLGAHLSMRETYAIFPALYNSADYVIVDVFSQKLATILDVKGNLVRDVIENMMVSNDYALETACGNLFVFKRSSNVQKPELLPMQKRYELEEKMDLDFFESVAITDYELPETMERGKPSHVKIVYVKREEESLDGYVLFMSFINEDTGEMYQLANLPSFAFSKPIEWKQGYYYIEDQEIVLPKFLDPGKYKIFIGMGNKIRTRSMYLGDMQVK